MDINFCFLNIGKNCAETDARDQFGKSTIKKRALNWIQRPSLFQVILLFNHRNTYNINPALCGR